jgi:hypothetical protein
MFALAFVFALAFMFAFAFMFTLLASAFVVEGAFVLFALPLEFLLPLPQSRRRTAVLSTTVRAISLNISFSTPARGAIPKMEGKMSGQHLCVGRAVDA